ncbi:hypothetical protein ES319_A03G220600v1 [Gossypium barbadense]|uniref:Uncharacterized protein n=1 Tax=Gossypium barbadense TaxID=3634 RepID=A0A5J5WIP7_GOSBA|nr:hypothetical protein ES319_A03G220600v1 [Gossypium barbadense]
MGYHETYSLNAWKWLGFVSAVWVQAISGNNYTFSNYSDAIKTLMNLTQLELNNLSVAKDIGKAFGLIGYGVQWLVVSQKIQPLPYWQMCIFLCMGGNSTTWMNTAVLVTCIRNFRRNRGPVSGILKGYVGLSTAIFTDICSALFSDNPAKFLIMLSVIPFAVCLTAFFFLRETPQSVSVAAEKEEARYFAIFNIVAVVVAFYLLAYDFIGSTNQVFSLVFVITLLVLLASPLAVPVYSFCKSWRLARFAPDVERREPLLEQEANAAAERNEVINDETPVAVEEAVVVEKSRPVLGEDHTIFEAMGTWDFWLLFVSFLCGVGTGLAVMNNMAQIGLALGHADVSFFVSLISIWGFFGRITSGSVRNIFSSKKAGTPRPLWNAASQILMAVGFLVMALAMPGCLYIGSIIVGACYGVRLAVSVPVASELFGLKYYGLLYNVLILNLPIGGGNTCVGSHCYRLVFSIMALASILGFGLDVLLTIRSKYIYTKIFTRRKSKKPSTTTESNGQ